MRCRRGCERTEAERQRSLAGSWGEGRERWRGVSEMEKNRGRRRRGSWSYTRTEAMAAPAVGSGGGGGGAMADGATPCAARVGRGSVVARRSGRPCLACGARGVGAGAPESGGSTPASGACAAFGAHAAPETCSAIGRRHGSGAGVLFPRSPGRWCSAGDTEAWRRCAVLWWAERQIRVRHGAAGGGGGGA